MSEEIAAADANLTEIRHLRAALARSEEVVKRQLVELAAARKALDAVVTDEGDDPCRYDHHGYCQAHALQKQGECYMELARAAQAMRTTLPPSPPSYALVPVEDLRAAELCELAARRLRREDLSEVSIAEAAVVEQIAAVAIQAERESRTR